MKPKKDQDALELKIKRSRSRISANVKTGSAAASWCGGASTRTDPTGNGYACPTYITCLYCF
jgi:hypothetical protein